MKMHNGFTKYMLRQSMNTLLPSSITWRTDKVGFEPPQHQWMQDKHLQERIHIAKEVMVKEKILDAKVLTTSIQPQDAYSANNFDWRYLSAAVVL
jgi:asparagine synthase (glutamine-hydrolysing)